MEDDCMATARFITTQKNYTITADLRQIGTDLLITVTGGDNPHIGVVTTLTKQTKIETVRYPSHDGRFHKDDFISRRIAQRIQAHLIGSATILAGVHVNQITQNQIAASAPMSDQLAGEICEWLAQHPVTSARPEYYSDHEQPK
jgi:hypothetical protein